MLRLTGHSIDVLLVCVFIRDRRASFLNTGTASSLGTGVGLSGSLRLFNGIAFAFVYEEVTPLNGGFRKFEPEFQVQTFVAV
jgi:hypothetical protein